MARVMVVATYDFLMDLGSGDELVLRGQEFPAPPSFSQSSEERARSLVKMGAAVLPADWPKYRDRTQAGHDAAKAMVGRR